MEENKIYGTQDMPEPQILSYKSFFKVNEVFINDFRQVVGEMPYADVKPFFDTLESHNNVLPVAVLNEFIRAIASLPYKYVHSLMKVINQKDKFNVYFTELTNDNTENAGK